MLENIEYPLVKSKLLPTISELIFGKIFDYKYQQKKSLKYQIFKFEIQVVDYSKYDINFIFPLFNKNEKLCEENFKEYKNLEKELNFLYEHPIIREDMQYFKWDIQSVPKYPQGNIHIFRLAIKEDLIVDFNLVSNKTKLHYKLNQRLKPKNKQLRSKI